MTVKQRPILFKGEMVRAILSGEKTMTRRVVKGKFWFSDGSPDVALLDCPCGKPGDRLWVREKFSRHMIPEGEPYFYPADRVRECVDHDNGFHYWADGNPEYGDWERPKPSIHMPRCASRITLEITNIRVERLQDITPADAKSEGIHSALADVGGLGPSGSYIDNFRILWESINSADSWDANPWVWVVEFKRIPA